MSARTGMPDSLDTKDSVDISCRVNGETVAARVPVRQSLVDFLRHGLGLTGSHVGCEHGVCGACTIVLDGRCVRGCLLLAAQADGAEIETIEGATASGRLDALRAEFVTRAGLQCGFCTPGMLLTAAEFLDAGGGPDRSEIRDALSGNYCRCTGYHAIVDAVEAAARSHPRSA
ncbi:(2Fe-2S)-binding protein [Aquabacter spiritensis]|uniref:Carbon-monoxide dehydrogenase small subunit n=1 Tax=Aquabacter spiritensis TaxID=933073 RepID=A0A4V2UXN3_9HYPH|nr:(2Fe-2S)-binding protein [Aquabacter spiritensis]TCT04198.1 carbon-monoxide dehydrogenase small subunit [Aquabacter spiritensis]